MRLLCVSARKMSPLGATVMVRGPLRPVRNSSILKPGGNDSFAPSGFGTSRGLLFADGVSKGAGSFDTSTLCTRPGASFFQSASPLGGGGAGGGESAAGCRTCLRRGGPPAGPGARMVPLLTAVKYAIRFSRSAGFSTAMTMEEFGTTVVGDAGKRSSVAASQVRLDFFRAAL